MSVAVNSPITFTVPPPPEIGDLSIYVQAQADVERLTDLQCHAVSWALAVRKDEGLRQIPQAPVPARRKVGFLEALRAPVECCDPAVRASWALWRVCAYMVAAIFLVVLVAGMVFGKPGVVVVVGAVCLASSALSFRILQGEATVCH